jgi:hypothetical protein
VPKTQRPDVGGVGPKLEKRFIPRQPQSSSKAESPKQAADRSLVAGPYLELFARLRRPGWTAWGDELDKFEPKYDAHDDFAKSLDEGYRVIRERVAAGGPKWVPK